MLKKVMALAATALFSLNASAGYIQYDFQGPISGYIVQHDDDQSIAAYRFNVPLSGLPTPFMFTVTPLMGDGVDAIVSETTHFKNNGPTSFEVFDNYGADRGLGLIMDLTRSTGGNFMYKATFNGAIMYATMNGNEFLPFSGTLSGLLTKNTVNPGLAASLDSFGGYDEGVPAIVPRYVGPTTHVPEPGSLALLAAGALSAVGVARRRKAAR